MTQSATNFNDITLLITHFNRSKSLERLLSELKKIGCNFTNIIVSDDCSSHEHLDYIQLLEQEFNFKLISGKQNKGLGNNLNKGLS
ncbi:MAG: glycosyltransferase, partial [Flavobacterium sp.]